MKKFLIYSLLLLTNEKVFASCSIDSALKHSTSEPNLFTVIGALFFVIALIYVTGIVYTKLNVIGTKVNRKNLKDLADDKIIILSTTQLSGNKTLHVIEINGNKLLIGVSQNGISLIKELKTTTKKYETQKNEAQNKTEEDKALDEIFNIPEPEKTEPVENDEDFGLYKKYL